MYTIPLESNIEKLKGNSVVQICYTVNSVSVFFENIGFIGIEGSFLFTDGNKHVNVDDFFPLKEDWGLLHLLEKKLINIEIDSERTDLTLYFEENKSLTLFGNPQYESYSINIDGRRIIV